MLKKDLFEFKWAITKLGVRYPDGKIRTRYFIYAVVSPFLTVNAIVYILKNYDDVHKRIESFKGLIMCLLCYLQMLAIIFKWSDIMMLQNLIKKRYNQFPFFITELRQNLEQRIRDEVIQLNTLWYYLLVSWAGTMILLPILVFIVQVLRHGVIRITANMLYLSLPMYFSPHYDTLPIYFTAYSIQSFYFIQVTICGYINGVPPQMSMRLIEGQLKLLRLSVLEMDEVNYHKDNENKFYSKSTLDSAKYSNWSNEQILKLFLSYFVKHHNEIYRSVIQATHGMQMIAFSIQSGFYIALCSGIYSMVKGQVLLLKLQEVIYCCLLIYILYCYNYTGEKIAIQDDQLRNELYESRWLEKPLWFQRSLNIIFTRMNTPIEIRKTGLFVLNLKNFGMVSQAAYSFYNILVRITD